MTWVDIFWANLRRIWKEYVLLLSSGIFLHLYLKSKHHGKLKTWLCAHPFCFSTLDVLPYPGVLPRSHIHFGFIHQKMSPWDPALGSWDSDITGIWPPYRCYSPELSDYISLQTHVYENPNIKPPERPKDCQQEPLLLDQSFDNRGPHTNSFVSFFLNRISTFEMPSNLQYYSSLRNPTLAI
jgi:hypothetical protein